MKLEFCLNKGEAHEFTLPNVTVIHKVMNWVAQERTRFPLPPPVTSCLATMSIYLVYGDEIIEAEEGLPSANKARTALGQLLSCREHESPFVRTLLPI